MHIKKLVAGVLCAVMCCFIMGVTVSAATYSVSKDDAKIFSENTELQEAAKEVGISVGDNGKITVETSAMTDKTEKEQKKAMREFVDAVNDAGIRSTGAISNAINDSYDGVLSTEIMIIAGLFDSVQGDLTGAMGIIKPFLPIINIIIGVVALIVLAMLVLSTVIDLAFIGLPAVREMMMSGGDDKGSGSGTGTKPKALTYACWATINDVEGSLGSGGNGSSGSNSGSGYKNAYGTYFKRRVWDYVLLGVCLSFLIFGGFSRFITALLNIGSDLVG